MNVSDHVFLLSGAAGFVGANLCRRLVQEGAEVHILVKPRTALWRIEDIRAHLFLHMIDIRQEEDLQRLIRSIRPDVIYHLATSGAYHYQTDVQTILSTNVLGLWNLLNACDQVDYKLFVNTGSSSEYGTKSSAMQETDLLTPNSVYGVAKAAQSLLCQQHAQTHDRPIVTLRLSSVYGPYEEPTRLIPRLVVAALDHCPLDMVAPATARDFIYIDDVVETYLKIDALHACRGEIFNLGTGRQASLAQVVQTLEAHLGRPVTIRWNAMAPRSWDTTTWVTDVSKLQRLVEIRPQISLSEGIARCVAWFSQHREFYPEEQLTKE